MSTNLVPFNSDGGFTTAGNITAVGQASPAPSINGFSSVNSDNISLITGYIKGGTATVVDDGINSIAQAPGAQMDVYGFPFSQITRGQLTISSVATPSEVNGTWYYQSVNTNTYQIYTDSTYATLVDASGWSAYTGGGSVAITKQVPAANIVINSNGFFSKFDNTGNLTLPGTLIIPGTIATTSISQVGSSLVIETGSAYGDTAVSIASDPTLASTYPAGSTITFQDGDVRTITGYDDYPGGTDIFWNTSKTGTLFPITLKTSNYAPASAANANIIVGNNTWTFNNTGVATLPGEGVLQSIGDSVTLRSLNTTTGNANSVYLGSSGGLGFNDQEIGGNWLEIFRTGTEPEIRVPVGRGNLNIQTARGETPYNWVFSDTGKLTMPGPAQLAVYANATVRDSSISSPTPGMMIYVTGTGMQVRGDTSWNTILGSGT